MCRLLILFLLLPAISFLQSCSKNNSIASPSNSNNPSAENQTWLVPSDQIFDGGPGKDGIPSIDNPQFTDAGKVDFLQDDDLVLIISSDSELKAYPHPILDWHEIVNDDIGSISLAITYCPLTGTGIGWNRMLKGKKTSFGVSGLLYNTNLMPYDRLTNSTWSQQRLDCVNGELIGTIAETYSMVETTFATMKESFPLAQVMNTSTGFNRDYGRYPYGDYKENNGRIIFPISTTDNRLQLKERSLGVLLDDNNQKVYPFANGDLNTNILHDKLGNTDLTILRNKSKNFIVAFEDNGLSLELVENQLPIILKDKSGNTYDLLGRSSDGSVSDLVLPRQFIGYWFSWGTFYPGISLWAD